MEKLRIACFPTSVFPIIPVSPTTFRRKNRATFSPESEYYPFSINPSVAIKVSQLGSGVGNNLVIGWPGSGLTLGFMQTLLADRILEAPL